MVTKRGAGKGLGGILFFHTRPIEIPQLRISDLQELEAELSCLNAPKIPFILDIKAESWSV